jgi:anti-sigma factor RsiW
MAHLNDDVAPYVDGQLGPDAAAEADRHLASCESCQHAVMQQRMLKHRMSGRELPLPPGLIAALGAVPTASARRSRVLPQALGALLVVLGASMAVVGVAYAVAPAPHEGDPVAPRAENLASIANSFRRPGDHLGDEALDELDRAGWPSRQRLGYDHYRLDGRMHGGRDVVAQMYVGRGDVLVLVEQVGSLDVDELDSFRRHFIAEHQLWVREGRPRVLTWDSDGMVYAVVTSLPDHRLAHLLDDLPAPEREPSHVERVGDGLVRLTSWLN